MSKKHISFTLTEGNGKKAISATKAIKELIRAILIYAAFAYIPAALVIIILALIFRFNVIIPLLIAVPVALVIGLLVIILSARINERPDEFAECSKDFAENGFFSEENLNILLNKYEQASKDNETGLRNMIIIFLANHYKSDAIQQPHIAADYLSEYYFDNSKPLTSSKKYLRLNYYVCAIYTYIHFDDSEKIDNIYQESASLFEECSKEEICRPIIRGALFYYFICKNKYDKAASLLTEVTDTTMAGDMKAELIAAQGDYNGARHILNELLQSELSDNARKLLEQRLYSVDLLEQGKIRHLYDYIPQNN